MSGGEMENEAGKRSGKARCHVRRAQLYKTRGAEGEERSIATPHFLCRTISARVTVRCRGKWWRKNRQNCTGRGNGVIWRSYCCKETKAYITHTNTARVIIGSSCSAPAFNHYIHTHTHSYHLTGTSKEEAEKRKERKLERTTPRSRFIRSLGKRTGRATESRLAI